MNRKANTPYSEVFASDRINFAALQFGAADHDLHIDAYLSGFAMNFMPMGFIADRLFPTVPVMKQSDLYPIFDQGEMFRAESDLRAPGTLPAFVDQGVSSASYYCYNRALATAVPYEYVQNADPEIVRMYGEGAVRFLLGKLHTGWEIRSANLCRSTSNVGSSSTVASAWTAWASGNSDPIGNIESAINVVKDRTGYRPNRIVMGEDAWKNFKNHADVITRIHGDGIGAGSRVRTVSEVQAAALFEVDEVLVGRASHNSAAEGQTMALTKTWGDDVLVYYATPTPSIIEPTFGATFRWRVAGVPEMVAETFERPRTKAREIHIAYYQDEKITGANFSFLIKATTSAQ